MWERAWLTQLEETGRIHGGGDIWALSGVTQVLERFSGTDRNVACSKMMFGSNFYISAGHVHVIHNVIL